MDVYGVEKSIVFMGIRRTLASWEASLPLNQLILEFMTAVDFFFNQSGDQPINYHHGFDLNLP